jgi:hypothetical protein
MATMISEVYDAFRAANVPEDKAREAAEAVANLDNRLGVIEAKLTMMQWVLSGVGFGVLILVIKSFVQ